MQIARVIGNIVASQKQEAYSGAKLLLVQPLSLEGDPQGDEVLAVDAVDAGPGDQVLIVQEGFAASKAVGKTMAPIDTAIIAVIDEIRLFKQHEQNSDTTTTG